MITRIRLCSALVALVTLSACGPLPQPAKPVVGPLAGYSLYRADCERAKMPGSYIEQNSEVFSVAGDILGSTMAAIMGSGNLGDFSASVKVGLDVVKAAVTVAGHELSLGGDPLRIPNLAAGLACLKIVHEQKSPALSVAGGLRLTSGGVALTGGAAAGVAP